MAVLEKECKLASVGSERLCSRGSASNTNMEGASLALCWRSPFLLSRLRSSAKGGFLASLGDTNFKDTLCSKGTIGFALCWRSAPNSSVCAFAAMRRRLATRLLLLAVAFADEADDTRAAAAADHLRAGELKELLTKAGVEFG